MNVSSDIVARLNDILPHPGCVYEAIEPILESCLTPERLEERTWLGIKLSICEFQAANVKFPAVCSNQRTLSACTQLLETKPTWWTTFSGNYRHISAICLEYQPQFESQKVLRTFRDASKLFESYQSELEQVLSGYELKKSDLIQRLQRQSEELSKSLADANMGLISLKRLLHNASSDAKDMLAPLRSTVNAAEIQLQHILESGKILADQNANATRGIALFERIMTEVASRHIQVAELLQRTVNNTVSSLDREVKSLQSTLKSVKTVLRMIGMVVTFIWPIAAFALVALLLTLVAKPKQRAQAISIGSEAEECDLVFY